LVAIYQFHRLNDVALSITYAIAVYLRMHILAYKDLTINDVMVQTIVSHKHMLTLRTKMLSQQSRYLRALTLVSILTDIIL